MSTFSRVRGAEIERSVTFVPGQALRYKLKKSRQSRELEEEWSGKTARYYVCFSLSFSFFFCLLVCEALPAAAERHAVLTFAREVTANWIYSLCMCLCVYIVVQCGVPDNLIFSSLRTSIRSLNRCKLPKTRLDLLLLFPSSPFFRICFSPFE